MEKITFVNVPVKSDFDLRLRLAAAQQKVSRAEVARRAMEAYLARFENQGREPTNEPAITTRKTNR